MESNREVVSLEPRKFVHEPGTFKHSCLSGGHARRWRDAVIIGLTFQWLCFGYGALPARAQTETATEEPKRPALQIGSALRFNEDWSTLKGVDLSRTDDFWDRLKYIPLTQDESVWLSFGGQARLRLEYFNQFQWGRFGTQAVRCLPSVPTPA